jgi:RNA polymerase sigma factor (TIGR02999 family)
MQPDAEAVTDILRNAESGDREAVDALFRAVYDELHVLARRQRRRWQGEPSLNTTALVHEAYLKLVNADRLAAGSRAHFFAIAARAMRQILVNYALAARAQKRGGDVPRVALDALADALLAGPSLSLDQVDLLVRLDDALKRLASLSERQSRVVECRFFAGMSIPETAVALDTSAATVKRDWSVAQAWLFRELTGRSDG